MDDKYYKFFLKNESQTNKLKHLLLLALMNNNKCYASYDRIFKYKERIKKTT